MATGQGTTAENAIDLSSSSPPHSFEPKISHANRSLNPNTNVSIWYTPMKVRPEAINLLSALGKQKGYGGGQNLILTG